MEERQTAREKGGLMQVTATYSTAYHFRGKLVRVVHGPARSSMYRSSRSAWVLMSAKGLPSEDWSKGTRSPCDGAGSTGRIRDLRLNHQMEHEKGRGFPLGALAEFPPRNSPTQPRSMFPGRSFRRRQKLTIGWSCTAILYCTPQLYGTIKLYHTSLARGLRLLVDRPLIRRQDAISDQAV